uniref:PiggyBac transposable element-derived protein domain-containing protein n=1 Tax=Neogobius melanostomus TaxID=47308 RepID=A0A8C6SAS8_9GOBI
FSDDECSDISDEEWLPEKNRDMEAEDDGDTDSQDAESEDDEGQDAEEGQHDQGAVEDGHMAPDHTQARKNIWKVQDNDFDGDLHLFPADLIDDITYNTNLYALQKGKENLAVTGEEMQIFLGINLIMGYIRYPRARMYWSSEDGLRLGIIANAMSVNRYEQILRYLHFVDNLTYQQANMDRLFKIRPFLSALQETFKAAADPEEFQSVDEQIIPFKGLLSIKQYIPKNPNPGSESVGEAGTSGYTNRFEVYQGSASSGCISGLGMAGDVVMRLCDDIKHKNHKVFFDNFFCSIPLIEALKDQGIYGTGTCRANRLKGANQKLKSQKQLKEMGRGACSVVSNNANITVTRWLDSSVVHMVSSCAGQSPEDVANRWVKKDKTMMMVQKPFSVALYNQHMGGVDLVDQCLAMYPTDVETRGGTSESSVARALINSGTLQQNKRGRPIETPQPVKRRAVTRVAREVRFGAGYHWPQLTKVKNANRCHDAACTRKTKYICMHCCVPLCPGCFANFHTKNYWS